MIHTSMLGSGITMTKAEALKIQSEQCAWYETIYPGITEMVKARTFSDALEDNMEYDMVTINKHIPRGGNIEFIAKGLI